jgi:hypothetical protein
MKTTLEKEKEDRAITEDVMFYEIGQKGGLIPHIVEDERIGQVVSVTFCENISGGQDQVNNMPKTLTLTKLEMIDGELHRFTAEYHINL